MSQEQRGRPPLAPKPSPATLKNAETGARDASPALRGANLAFGHGAKAAASNQNHNQNAALAAAAAGRARPQKAGSNGIGTRTTISPARGRSQLTLDLEQASKNLQVSSYNPQATSPHPLSRTASEIAARAASASTSPARTSESATSRASSPHRRFQPSISRETSSLPHGTARLEDGNDALRGATASMSNTSRPVMKTALSESPGKLDFYKIPSLAMLSSAGSSPPRQPTSASTASAARSATMAAEARSKESESASRVIKPVPRTSHFASRRFPPHTPQLSSSLHSTRSAANSHLLTRTVSSDDSLPASAPPIHHLLPSPRPAFGKTSPMHPGTPSMHSGESPSMTATSLADAMVASSLASSRVQSPAPSKRRPKPPAVPLRRSLSLNFREHKPPPENPRLKPIVMRPMRQTLRTHSPNGDEDEETKRGRKHLLRKHPNKHHEGDRKRWRDRLTEGERKRYEGVWAANRGLLHQHEATDVSRHRPQGVIAEDLVVNVVVRDIWDRSRLPRDVLEEVWDLVTDEDSKALNREEFVVGLWLIDQWLKGRKLPAVKVSPSVWSSVRHTQGVKIRSKPY